MEELRPIDRLHVHLFLYYPKSKRLNVWLSQTPGFIIAGPAVIDIRGAGYAKEIDGKKVHPLRLWYELHDHFNTHVHVVKEKHKQPTVILWNGKVFRLDHEKTYGKRGG